MQVLRSFRQSFLAILDWFSSKIVNFIFVLDTNFHDFVLFSSKNKFVDSSARQLTRKSTHINDSLFFIRMLYKDAYWRFDLHFFLFFVLISAFPLYFVAFCQCLIYEYMDMDMDEACSLTGCITGPSWYYTTTAVDNVTSDTKPSRQMSANRIQSDASLVTTVSVLST